ncbi:hypothetical protein O3W44_23675 [Pantoea sp. LMR881]|uniref:hypothetical protein n=1 Tax=Pantoea sp. LMR881 TaxID=3014336 RepID=UPI0022AE5605|nr:hypothetical protein [Pantoea sp. LMR881]MCZ4061495.1 hypothetical protein [Pantoea sp. LMR881]
MDKTSFLSTRNTGLDFYALLTLEGVLYHEHAVYPEGIPGITCQEKMNRLFYLPY